MWNPMEYESVRVRQLLRPPEQYDGYRLNKRPPAVGDIGVVVHVMHAPGLPDLYVVESPGKDGVPIWLCDFAVEEMEHYEPHSQPDTFSDGMMVEFEARADGGPPPSDRRL